MVPEPTTVIAALGVVMLGVGAMLKLLPVGTCPQCGHCRLAELQREADLEARAARFYGVPRCGACGRYHDPSEDHPA